MEIFYHMRTILLTWKIQMFLDLWLQGNYFINMGNFQIHVHMYVDLPKGLIQFVAFIILNAMYIL